MIRVVHVIAGLEMGGVQTMLLRLVSRMDCAAFHNEVIVLTRGGEVLPMLIRAGARVTELGMRPGVPDPRGLWRLGAELRRHRTDVVQTWMYHSDLMGGLAARWTNKPRVVWGLHAESLPSAQTAWHAWLSAKLCVRLSYYLPDRIVCVSEAGRKWHVRYGYNERLITVIPNGFDTDYFRPDGAAYHAIRRELGLAADAVIVGHVGRFDPQKDHRGLIQAAAQVLEKRPNVQFLLCGHGIDSKNMALRAWIADTGRAGHFHLLGIRTDIERVAAAMDVMALSSTTEAFASCVGEAMACGVPVVTTAVGDLPQVVGDTGVLVPPRDPEALARGILGVLAAPDERCRRGMAARERIKQLFGLDRMVRAYEDCYRQVLG
jgi:glycosyltransferase involved in cell wall biosynthesis